MWCMLYTIWYVMHAVYWCTMCIRVSWGIVCATRFILHSTYNIPMWLLYMLHNVSRCMMHTVYYMQYITYCMIHTFSNLLHNTDHVCCLLNIYNIPPSQCYTMYFDLCLHKLWLYCPVHYVQGTPYCVWCAMRYVLSTILYHVQHCTIYHTDPMQWNALLDCALPYTSISLHYAL